MHSLYNFKHMLCIKTTSVLALELTYKLVLGVFAKCMHTFSTNKKWFSVTQY